jgi:hypothetical protein
MAQTGYTPILIYSSSTAAAAPVAGNLTNSTLGSELAINITDGKLFYKDNANAVQVIAWKTTPTTAGGTGLTSYTAGDLLYYATGTTLSKLAIGASTTVLTSSGTAPQWTAQSALSVGTAANLLSNATTGVMQIAGPGTGTTRVMTIPDANFTAARTDAAQTFSGLQTFGSGVSVTSGKVTSVYGAGGDFVALFQNTTSATPYCVWIKDAATPAAGYPLLNISNDAGTTVYFRVDSSNGNATLGPGNLIIGTSGKGIDFSANTPAAGMTSELLNWYEEGTFTPTVEGSTTAGTATYTVQVGRYTRIGNRVMFNLTVVYSGHTGTGNLYVTGYPFTSADVANTDCPVSIYIDGIALSANNVVQTIFFRGTKIVSLQQYPVGGGAATAVAMDAAGEIRLAGTYFV